MSHAFDALAAVGVALLPAGMNAMRARARPVGLVRVCPGIRAVSVDFKRGFLPHRKHGSHLRAFVEF